MNKHRGSDFADFIIEENLMNTNQSMKPYYYVYKYSDRGPRVRHSTIEQAQAEAERLSGQHPGDTFEILKAVGITRCTQASTFWMDGEGPQHPLKANAPRMAEIDHEEPPEKPCYRILEHGEITQLGDEFTTDHGVTWRPVSTGAGVAYQEDGKSGRICPHYPHRRPL